MSHASRIAEQLRMAADDEGTPEEDRQRLRERADELESEHNNADETETMRETDNTDETDESTDEETTPIGAEHEVPLPGMLAIDRTDLEGNRCVVVCVRQRRAGNMTVAATGKTIAEHQREWEDAEWAEDVARHPVVDVVYKGALEERWEDEWQEWPASWLTYKVGNEGMRTYSFPVGRLLFGREYAAVMEEQGREPASTLPEDPAVPDVACVECGEAWDEGETKAEYATHFGECPECGGDLEGRLVTDDEDEEPEVMTDGGTVEKAEPDETLLLTDEGLQMPDMLRGYVGQFHVRTADITGQYNTTETGLPDTDFWDGVLAVYPTDDGDYNPHLGPGLIEVYTTSREASKVFKIEDKRTDVPEGERQ